MWRRATTTQLRLLAGARRSAAPLPRRSGPGGETLASASAFFHSSSPSPMPFRCTPPLLSSESANPPSKKKVEDVMPIATGLEREEIEAELEGQKRFDMDAPTGPFGTKEAPAVIKSVYNKRIVGCPGGEGEDEHDVVWFWLEKNKPHECPVCSQYFVLEVIGEGGDPDGHSDHEHH